MGDVKPLGIACIDGAKYDESDTLGKVLAYVCMAPYIFVICQATVVYSRRELHGVMALVGLLANQALCKILKNSLRQSRPDGCHALDVCHEYGMPSAHTQMMFFIFALYTLLTTRGPSTRRWWHVAEGGALGILACLVGYGRIYLGYHDLAQVACGALIGVAFAALWYRLTQVAASNLFPRLSGSWLARALCLRDTFPLGPDLPYLEYCQVVEARGSSGRSLESIHMSPLKIITPGKRE